jgi:hypothetical protein
MPEMGNESSSHFEATHVPLLRCADPSVGQHVTEYCFGDATEQQRQQIEAHLLECDACWREVQRLDASIRELRSNRSLIRTLMTPGALGVIGLSGKLERHFAGHLWHALGATCVSALLYAVSLVFEVAYQFDSYGFRVAFVAVLGVLPWVWGTTMAALAADVAATRRGKTTGLSWSVLISCAAVLLLLAGTSLILPNHPITLMRVQAYPAQAAYVKNTLYYVPLCVVFLLVPFHFVLTMQRQLRDGRHRRVFALLAGEKTGVTPRGTVFVKVWQLSVVLGCAGLASFHLTSNLMDNLVPAPHMNLFVNLVQIRTFLYFALAVGCLVWYSRALDEIRRECVALLQAPHP